MHVFAPWTQVLSWGSVIQTDLNGDGRPDVIAGSNGANFAFPQALLGLPDGGFEGPYALPYFAYVIEVANLPTGPAIVDRADYQSNSHLDVLQGWVDGGFTSITSVPLVSGEGNVGVGDFNGDGTEEVVLADDQMLKTFEFPSDGGIVTHTFDAGIGDWSLAWVLTGDMNGDGISDVIATWRGSGCQNHKYLGSTNFDFGFGESTGAANIVGCPAGGRAAEFDVNGDGIDDIFWTGPWNQLGPTVVPELWAEVDASDGGHAWYYVWGAIEESQIPSISPYVTDLDGDGRPDVLVRGSYPDAGIWFETFRSGDDGGIRMTFRSDSAPIVIRAVFDVDGDGVPDLVGEALGPDGGFSSGNLAWVRGPCY